MKKRFLAVLMAALSTMTIALSGCEMVDKIMPIKDGPNYSDSKLQFDFYGYSSLIDGWNIDGVSFDVEEDYLSVDRIKEYKDAGMTIYFPQSAAGFNGNTPFEQSETKRAMDTAIEAGMDKVILMDSRIQSLSKTNGGIVGEGKKFATQEALELEIASYMEPYRYHEAFYGVMLGDEPFHLMAESYGQVYRAIKAVAPDCYIQYNLNPITAGTGTNSTTDERNIDVRFPALVEGDEGYGAEKDSDEELIARYRKYIRSFMDSTGAPYIQYDQYPFRSADKADAYYLLGLQVVAELAKEYDAAFYFVTQTYGQTEGSYGNPRMLSEADLYWLNNMLVGFGIKQISYFTYFTKADNNAEHFIDGNSFITWRGEKTDIYHWMKQIMTEEQKLAPTILNFEYTTSKVFTKMPMTFSASYVGKTLETADFKALKDVTVNKEVGLVTELYDAKTGNYMYMAQNIVDPVYKGSKTYQTMVLTFDAQYKYAVLFEKGERRLVKLDKANQLTLKHTPGAATYVIPY